MSATKCVIFTMLYFINYFALLSLLRVCLTCLLQNNNNSKRSVLVQLQETIGLHTYKYQKDKTDGRRSIGLSLTTFLLIIILVNNNKILYW